NTGGTIPKRRSKPRWETGWNGREAPETSPRPDRSKPTLQPRLGNRMERFVWSRDLPRTRIVTNGSPSGFGNLQGRTGGRAQRLGPRRRPWPRLGRSRLPARANSPARTSEPFHWRRVCSAFPQRRSFYATHGRSRRHSSVRPGGVSARLLDVM